MRHAVVLPAELVRFIMLLKDDLNPKDGETYLFIQNPDTRRWEIVI